MLQNISDVTAKALHPLRRFYTRARLRRAKANAVLFVCQGNLCRSPYAAALLSELSNFGERDLDVESAGFMTEIPTPPRIAIDAAASHGVNLSDHVAKLVTRALVVNSDLIVVMEARQRQRMQRIFRTGIAPVIVLGDLDPQLGNHRDIEDPIQKPREVFEATYSRIDRCVDVLAQLVSGTERDAVGRIVGKSTGLNAANVQQVRHNVRRIAALPLLRRNPQTEL